MNLDDEFDAFPRNEDQPLIRELLLNVPPLEQIKNDLYNELRSLYDELEIEVVPCPPLTSQPYNLSADGLSGSTGIVIVGEVHTLIPDLQRELHCNVPRKLHEHYGEFFLIGGGYCTGAESYLPSAGYLSTDICTYRFPLYGRIFVDELNRSYISYEDATTGKKKFRITYYNMEYSMFSNFFVSKGKSGMVIKVRAKGRRTNFDILTLMQCCLFVRYPNINIGLGGVLHINGGKVIHYVTPEIYPESFSEPRDLFRWLNIYEVSCENLITVGAFFNDPNLFYILGQCGDNKFFSASSRYKFYNTQHSEAMGQFINDTTPNETEYIGYFNVAENMYSYN